MPTFTISLKEKNTCVSNDVSKITQRAFIPGTTYAVFLKIFDDDKQVFHNSIT
jgi:hypothetical protein